MNIKVRFPPSPTGPMHIGTARAMLFNYLFAKGNNGQIIFRSEDTDRERSTKAFEEEIMTGLKWLGLDWDEGPFRQSERYEIYERYFAQLQESGAIYPCYCSAEEMDAERAEQKEKKLPPGYGGRCRDLSAEQIEKYESEGRKPVWRFRVPDAEIAFTDLVRGEIKEQGKHIKDFVVRKANGQFLYHFVVVADDIEMGISHVIRGEDHISNTSKHILLFKAFGAELPAFAHLPLLLNADKSKMSKRDATGRPMTLERLEEDGYLPAAVVNYLAALGWNPGDGDTREFFSMADLIKEFSLDRVQKSGAIFDLERLKFINAHYLNELPKAELAELVRPHCDFPIDDDAFFLKCLELAGDRLKLPSEAPDQLRMFFVEPDVDPELYPHKKMKVELPDALKALEFSLPILEELSEDNWNEEALQEALITAITAAEIKNGVVLWPLRVALTGEKFSPGTFEVAALLGKTRSIQRITKELDKLKNNH